MAVTFDQLLEQKVGAFGIWQLVAFSAVLFCSNSPFLQFQQLALTTPRHFCAQPTLEAEGWTRAMILNATVPKLPNNLGYDPCRQFNFSIPDRNASIAEQLRGIEDQHVVPCQHGWSYEEGPSVFSRSVPRDFNLVCESKVLASWCGSAYMLGMIPGPLIAGFLSDRYGRRVVCITASFFSALAAIATAFLSNSWFVFWILRFLVGCGASAANITGYVWGAECTSFAWQNTFNILFHFYANHVAEAYYIGLAAVLRDWRWLHAAIAVPHLLSVTLFLFVPESPRWLLLMGRLQDAAHALGRMAAGNRRQGTDFAALLAEDVKVDAALSDSSAETRETWKLLFTNRIYRVRLMAFIFLWIGMNLTFYGLSFFSVRLEGNPFVIAAIGSAILIPFEILKFLVFKFLRHRTLLAGGHLVATVIMLLFVLCLWLAPRHVINVVLATSGVGISFGISMMLFTLTPSLFPTATQNLAMGMLYGLSRIGNGLSTFVEKLDTFTGWRWLPAAILAAVTALGVVVSILVPLSERDEVEITVSFEKEEMRLGTEEEELEKNEENKPCLTASV